MCDFNPSKYVPVEGCLGSWVLLILIVRPFFETLCIFCFGQDPKKKNQICINYLSLHDRLLQNLAAENTHYFMCSLRVKHSETV